MKRLVVILALLPAVALAEAFTLKLHEVSHGSKGTRTIDTTFRVWGTKIFYESTYDGPEPDKPRNKPQKLEGKVGAEKSLAEALRAFDKTAATPASKAAPEIEDVTACISRKGKTRCEYSRGDDKPTPGWKALSAVTQLLFEGVPLPK